MNNIPQKIYLQIDADGETPQDFKKLEVSWCSDKIHANDIEYVLSTPSPTRGLPDMSTELDSIDTNTRSARFDLGFQTAWALVLSHLNSQKESTRGFTEDEMVKELTEIKKAFQWTWDNMDKPHTADHFNTPANGIEQLDRLIASLPPTGKVEGDGSRGLPEAINILKEELSKDKSEGSYYYGWQSNIAMAFLDELSKYDEINIKQELLQSIANNAAKNFLDTHFVTQPPKQ